MLRVLFALLITSFTSCQSLLHLQTSDIKLDDVLSLLNLSQLCLTQLRRYEEAFNDNEEWALQMFDSEAKYPPPGYLEGNIYDLGHFDECLNVQTEDEEIIGTYCLGRQTFEFGNKKIYNKVFTSASVQHSSANGSNYDVVVNLGKCFPSGCTPREVIEVYGEFGVNINFNVQCQTKRTQPTLNVWSVVTIGFLAAVLLITVLSTCYDVYCSTTGKKSEHEIYIAFSVLRNAKSLLHVSPSSHPTEITCLHGIRVLSMIWIILVHQHAVDRQFPIKNTFYLSKWMYEFRSICLLAGTLTVDSFLLLGGCLITYAYLLSSKKGKKLNIFLYYFSRYFRLAPVLILVVVIHITLINNMGSGPLWHKVTKSLVEPCETDWWRTIFFIGNIFGRGKPECVLPTWYTNVDMQLNLLSPLILLPLRNYTKSTIIGIIVLIMVSMVACFAIAWIFELGAHVQLIKSYEQQMNFVWYYYYQTHTRAGPWLVGTILGYVLFEFKEGRLQFPKSKSVALFLWTISLATFLLCTLAAFHQDEQYFDKLENSLNVALVRPVWAIAIGWVIFACVSGYGGPVNEFLSLPVFQVLSKLTYALFLVHFSLIIVLKGNMRTVNTLTTFESLHLFWANLAYSLIVSTILTLFVEFPMANLGKLLLG